MIWKQLPTISNEIQHVLDDYGRITSQLLYNRGIYGKTEAEKFFSCEENLIEDFELENIPKAVGLILEAVKKGEKIIIYGDYDVDGITATSILFDFLFRQLKANVLPYIPSRFDEGYGLNEKALEQFLRDKVELLITVDCGVRDGKMLEKVVKGKMKVVVTDHHEPPADTEAVSSLLASADYVIHPEFSPNLKFKSICAASVVWFLINELSIQAKQAGLVDMAFSPDKYLDLVALATVCDVMPLIDKNRIIVKKGLGIMKDTSNIGLRELFSLSGVLSEDLTTYHLGYVLGPRLNAAGRLETALDAVRLLTSANLSTTRSLARKLSDLNSQRQIITSDLINEAEAQLKDWGEGKKLIFIRGNDWPEGIVGLVAGRLCEKYHKPVLVTSVKNGKGVGSARSIKGFHITEAISELSVLLERFGGHAQAAGYTLLEENIEKFSSKLLKIAEERIKDEELTKELQIEFELQNGEISHKTIEDIEKFSPFGFGNKQPILLLKKQQVRYIKLVGASSSHIKLGLQSDMGPLDGIGFNLAHFHSTIQKDDVIDLVGYLDANKFMGETKIQFKIVDIKPSDDRQSF